MSSILLSNALVFDGHSPDLLADIYIAIVGDRIKYVGPDFPDGRFETEVDLAGKCVIPGLIDAHFHAYAADLDIRKLESTPHTYLAHHASHLLRNALHRGFTTVRDVGGADFGLWRAAEEGVIESPRLFFCGRAFSQTGGHSDMRSPDEVSCSCSSLNGVLGAVVDGADNLRREVREALRHGAHHIKVMVSGGIASESDPIWMSQYSIEELEAVVDEASRRRAYVAAHAYTAETIERAVRAGIRTVEHGNLIDVPTAEYIAGKDAYVVPTLIIYDAFARFGKETGTPQHTLDKLDEVRLKGQEAVQICERAGVKLGFGTDLLGEVHNLQLEEFRLRGEVQSPFDVLHSATGVNAAIVKREDELGCIRSGALADLLVIDGNPLEDLSLLYRKNPAIDRVMKGGEWVVSHA